MRKVKIIEKIEIFSDLFVHFNDFIIKNDLISYKMDHERAIPLFYLYIRIKGII